MNKAIILLKWNCCNYTFILEGGFRWHYRCSLTGIAQRLPLCVHLGQLFWNVPKVVSNPLANFLQGVRGYRQPSGKFVKVCQRVLATFANSTFLPEGCQHPLILGQRVLIILQSNCQRVLDILYRHLQEGCLINKESGNLFVAWPRN